MRRSKKSDDEKKLIRQKVRTTAIDIGVAILACCIGSFSLTAVMVPNGLTTGGITGISRMLQQVLPFSFSVIYYVLTVAVFISVIIFLGWKEAKKILLMSFLSPTMMVVFEMLDFRLLEENDILLAAVFCGVFSGISCGLLYWRGYSYCGTDALAKIFKAKLMPEAPLSKIILVIDGSIVLASAFVFGRNIALYALITQVIASKMIDIVMFGFETKLVQMEVLTDDPESLADYVMFELHRGATESEVRGMYTGKDKRKLTILCSPRESVLVRRFVAARDQNAMIIVTRVDTAWGHGLGFHDIRKD